MGPRSHHRRPTGSIFGLPTAVLQAPCRRCPIARTVLPTASRAVQHTSQPPRGAPQPQGAHGSLSAPASPAVGHVANGRISPAPAVPPHRVAIAEPPLSHTVSLHDRRLWYRSGASSAARHAPGGPRRGGAHGAPPSLTTSVVWIQLKLTRGTRAACTRMCRVTVRAPRKHRCTGAMRFQS